MPRADGRDQGRDRNSLSTRDIEGSGNNSCGKEMAIFQEPEALQSPQKGTAEARRVEVRPHRHPDSADGDRPEQGALARCD